MLSEDEQQLSRNLSSPQPAARGWKSHDASASLQTHVIYVEREANKAIDWYWVNKRSKPFFSEIIQEESEMGKPGAIELTVIDANLAGFSFELTLFGQRGVARKETVVNGKSWTAIGRERRQYRLGVGGKVAGEEVAVATVLTVESDETTEILAQLQLHGSEK
jgi:hypothetical protein